MYWGKDRRWLALEEEIMTAESFNSNLKEIKNFKPSGNQAEDENNLNALRENVQFGGLNWYNSREKEELEEAWDSLHKTFGVVAPEWDDDYALSR